MPPASVIFFESAAEFRAWLARHGKTHSELIVGFWKIGSGHPSMTWPESVDEALCFGWIDGVRKRIDDKSYQIRFTPRNKNSNWSAVNIAKAQALVVAGRMRPAGQAAYAVGSNNKRSLYANQQRANPKLTEEELEHFRSQQSAWCFFDACPPSYSKPILYWVVSAKKPATRVRRLAQLIEACDRKERLLK